MFLIATECGSKVQSDLRGSTEEIVITQSGIHDEEALNIYTDGSSFPNRKRAAGVGVVLMWVDAAGDAQTSEHAPTGYQSATIDEMEIQACTVGLQEARKLFPDLRRFKKIVLFSDSQYVTDNFVKAMNVWPQRGWRGANGTPVANIDLWKRLRKEANSCPLRVEARWVKGHKSNIYNRAADKLAKKSAGMPFNKPLSISQTARKWSDRKTQRGCVDFDGRAVKIRIISTEYMKHAREYEYRFEVIDPEDASYKDVDFAWHKHLLSRNKCLLVRLTSDQGRPSIERVLEELDPDDYRY
jgi:ribonuclease HI